jgi:hypothetical protein
VRIRAIFADGILQLLCEAAKVELLEQSSLVEQIQQILESIAPRNIRRVNINSRIVREQQLLWLTEIERENQLLWSQEITLAQPNVVQQLIKDFQAAQELGQHNLPELSPLTHKDKPRKLLKFKWQSALGFCLLLSLGWMIYAQFGEQVKNLVQLENSRNSAIGNTSQTKSASDKSEDSFAEAVRIANQASAAGKTATTSTQWLELAAMWQRASDLMAGVSPEYSRYQEAKIRTQLYRKYSETAQQEAAKSKL